MFCITSSDAEIYCIWANPFCHISVPHMGHAKLGDPADAATGHLLVAITCRVLVLRWNFCFFLAFCAFAFMRNSAFRAYIRSSAIEAESLY